MGKLTGWEREIRNGDILSVQINLLNKCTSRCKSCRKYEWPIEDTLSVEDVKRTLAVLTETKGLQTVVFSGGDPLLYKDFAELADYCDELGIRYSLITTLLVKDGDLLKKVAETAERIHVSVDSVYAKSYGEIRGVNERALDIVLRNIRYVQSFRKDLGLNPIRISSTISKMNYKEVYVLFDTMVNVCGCDLNYYFLHTWNDLKMSHGEKNAFYSMMEIVNEEDISNRTNAKSILLSRYDTQTNSQKCSNCYLPQHNATINANGDLYPCCKLLDDNGPYGPQLRHVYGNIRGKSYMDISKEFSKRFDLKYPQVGTLCDECGDRYNGVLSDLEKIHVPNKRNSVFF